MLSSSNGDNNGRNAFVHDGNSDNDYKRQECTLLYKVTLKSTGKNFVTNEYCIYLLNL